jgi:hypothetical membrane protein
VSPSASSQAQSTESRTAAWLTIGTAVAYQALLALLIFLRPDLDPSWHSVSEWAVGPHGWVMSGTFLVCSISYFSLFALLRTQLRSRMGKIGLALLLICAAGVAGAGIFTTDAMPFRPPLSTRGTLHVVSGTAQLVLFPVAALLISLGLTWTQGKWAAARVVLLWTACLPLLGFLCFAVYTGLFVVPLGPHAYGPGVNIGWPPRLAFITYTLWTVLVAWQVIRGTRMSRASADSRQRKTSRFSLTRTISNPND